jgi:predicted NBD/HSP70 family sugar kinase
LTEARHWFDRDLTSFALVTFGAGIGCGLVLDDRLVEGNLGASGLIDHLRVDAHGPPCPRPPGLREWLCDNGGNSPGQSS